MKTPTPSSAAACAIASSAIAPFWSVVRRSVALTPPSVVYGSDNVSRRRAREGLRKRVYRAGEVDVIAAYCADVHRIFLLTADEFDGRPALQLRLAPSRNNQRLGINWAEDFRFEARLTAFLGP